MNESEKTKEYEIAYLLSSEISEEKLDLEIAELEKIIKESGGEVVESNMPKKRWLSYEVKKQRQAYFGFIRFKIPTEGVGKIKSVLSLYKKIMRFLIVSPSGVKSKNNRGEISELLTAPIDKQEKQQKELNNGQSFEKKLESILNG